MPASIRANVHFDANDVPPVTVSRYNEGPGGLPSFVVIELDRVQLFVTHEQLTHIAKRLSDETFGGTHD